MQISGTSAIVTEAVARRATELAIEHVVQGSADKSRAFDTLIAAWQDDPMGLPADQRCRNCPTSAPSGRSSPMP